MNDTDSLFQPEDGRKPYNLQHLNALYDIKAHTSYCYALTRSPQAIQRFNNRKEAATKCVIASFDR